MLCTVLVTVFAAVMTGCAAHNTPVTTVPPSIAPPTIVPPDGMPSPPPDGTPQPPQ